MKHNKNIDIENILKNLNRYFSNRNEIEMAFLFGSISKDTNHLESDMDIAVYFNKEMNEDEESQIWSDIEGITRINTDFVVLNRAFPDIAYSALNGIPIIIKNRYVYLTFFLRTVSEAIDYRGFVESFWKLKKRRMSDS